MLQTHATGTRLSVPQSSWRNVNPGLIMICTSFLIINFPKIGKMMKDVLIGVNKKLGGYAQKVISEKLLPLSLVNVAQIHPPSTYFLCQSRALQWSSTGKFASGPRHVGSWNRKRERSTWVTVPPSSSWRWYIYGKVHHTDILQFVIPFLVFSPFNLGLVTQEGHASARTNAPSSSAQFTIICWLDKLHEVAQHSNS